MIRCLLLVCVACSSKPDRVVGKWQSEDGKGLIFDLRADGTLDIDPVADRRCEDDKPALDACRAKQRWSRDGSTVTLRRGAVGNTTAMLGMFNEGPPCPCKLELYELSFDNDSLTAGKERAVRVR